MKERVGMSEQETGRGATKDGGERHKEENGVQRE